jgi:Protein of unknown function DUF262
MPIAGYYADKNLELIYRFLYKLRRHGDKQMSKNDPVLQRSQLAEQRLKVDFDTYDVTVDELVRRLGKGRIEIAPVYQRQFRWDPVRQSRLIESILLGIPVPPLFMATNLSPDTQNQWEVVDGLQRLLTLVNFFGNEDSRKVAGLGDAALHLSKLDKLTELEGMTFEKLPEDIRTSFEDRPIKVVVLNDKSDLQVRFDLFERLNTGGIALTDQEVRECVYRGEFIDLLSELSQNQDFKTVVHLPKANWKDGTPEDYVLRFFAYLEMYKAFNHSVKDFLNVYIDSASKDPKKEERKAIFQTTFGFLAAVFPDGLKSRKGTTPINLFEGVTVGAALAIHMNPNLAVPQATEWVKSKELHNMTTGATNSRPRVSGRIEFSRDRFLEAA